MAFYITLTTEKPDYIHYLPKRMILEGDWEVAIVDIITKVTLESNHSEIFGFYTDLIEPCFVNGVCEQLLAQLLIKKQNTGLMQKTFECPHYMQILNKNFQSFSIQIKSIPFKSAKFILKLHFRQKSK